MVVFVAEDGDLLGYPVQRTQFCNKRVEVEYDSCTLVIIILVQVLFHI